MANFGAKILNNAVSALRAQQAIIANTGNNIANVNTPGFTRRVLQLQTADGSREAGGINVGNGVRIGGLDRVADAFLQKLLLNAGSEKTSTETQNEFLTRVEKVFSLTGDRNTIGSTLTAFFTAVNDLSANPSSIELRSIVIERAQDLTSTISQNYQYIADLQTEADQRVATELQTVNAITRQIADLNLKITVQEAGSTTAVAADERDQRDKLMADLAEKISFNSVEVGDGSVNIFLSNGFTLVNSGNSNDLKVTSNPSFGPGTLPPSLSGGILSYVVFDYNRTGVGAPQEMDLTKVLQAGGGSIGGYLKMRGYADPANTNAFQADGTLPEIAARIEAIARSLLTDVNLAYLGPDRGNAATPGYDPSSGGLDGSQPGVFGLFDFNYSGAKDFGIPVAGPADGKPTQTDLNHLVDTLGTVTNFSMLLQVNGSLVADPRKLAAALDTTTVPPALPVFASGDGRNMENMAKLKDQAMSLSAGAFTLTATLDESYNQTVGYVGNLKSASNVATKVAADNYNTAADRRDQVSAVSLDEEFSDLISFQKAYQASARMIKIADELMQQVVALL